MSVFHTTSAILGATFLVGLGLIGFDLLTHWVWKTFSGRNPKPNNDLKGKHVLVTGGSKGIGREVAKEFIRRGANVSILARNSQELSEASQEMYQIISSNDTSSSSLSSATPNNGTNRQKVLEISIDLTLDFDIVSRSVRYFI